MPVARLHEAYMPKAGGMFGKAGLSILQDAVAPLRANHKGAERSLQAGA